MLITSDLKIVGDYDLESWFVKENQIKLHPDVTIEASSLGGFGLFFNHDLSKSNSAFIELLRIPNKATYDINNLFDYLEYFKEHDPTSSKIIIDILTEYEPKGETEIIHCYLWALYVIKHNNPKDIKIKEISPYLEILLNTETLSVDENEEVYDEFIEELKQQKSNMKVRYLENISPILDTKILTFDKFFQIYQAVNSRTLEIPHKVDDESNDYSTNITMVPLLDFANHSGYNNSHFDVDKNLGDVLLMLDPSKVKSEGNFEITISYSPTESIQQFIKTYGFIPSLTQFQIFEYKLTDINSLIGKINGIEENYDMIRKWLNISSTIQIFNHKQKNCEISFTKNEFSLLFIPGLKYYSNWDKEPDFKQFFECLELPIQFTDFIKFYKTQENESDTINLDSEDLFGVTFNEAYICLSEILNQTGIEEVEEYTKLYEKFLEFFIEIAHRDVLLIDGNIEKTSSVIHDYLRYKRDLLSKLIAEYEKSHHLPLVSDEDDKPDQVDIITESLSKQI